MNIDFIDMDMLLKICILIVTIGIGAKIIKVISGIIFKVSFIIIILTLIFNTLS